MAYVRQHPEFPKFRIKKGIMPDFSGSNYADQEQPRGVMDGANRVFTLAYTPIRSSETVFKDGMMMTRASSAALTDGDYFVDYAGETIKIIFSQNQIPQPQSVIRVNYKYMQVT